MNRGIDHGLVFFADSDRVEFGQRLADIHEQFGITTLAYCLMDTHFHLLLHCPDGRLSEAMQRLGSMYTRHVNDRIGRDGALFRGRFASRVIIDDSYLLTACRYIHRNALDLPGIGTVDEYRWSSHRTYLGARPTPPWMRTDDVLAHWNGDATAFDAFVRVDDEAVSPDRVDTRHLRAMLAACALALDECSDDATDGRLARLLVVGWACQIGVAPSVVMEAFEIPTRGALQSAHHRARQRVAESPSLRAVVQRALELTSPPGRSRLGSDPWRDQRAAS